jgi:hypothetical protein
VTSGALDLEVVDRHRRTGPDVELRQPQFALRGLYRDVKKTLSPSTTAPRTAAVSDAGPKSSGTSGVTTVSAASSK